MNSILRNILAVILGMVVGSVVNMALVTLGPRVIPPPAGVDMTTVQSLSASIHLLTPKNFLFPFLAHALGTLAGAFSAYLIAGSHRSVFAYAMGAIFLLGGIAACFMIPAPAWFMALDLLGAYIPMAWLGALLGRRVTGGAVTARNGGS